MNKYELLRKVGFSEIFIEYLSKVEESDAYMHEIPEHINEQLSCDVNDYIVSESTNNISPWLTTKRT